MTAKIHDITAATIPLTSLGALADLRCAADLQVVTVGDLAWVEWRESAEAALERIFALSGATFYVRDGSSWRRFGCRLPSAGVPPRGEPRPLLRMLSPAPFQAEPPDNPSFEPLALRLVSAQRPRKTTALLCNLHDLSAWADGVPSMRLSALQAIRRDEKALMRGPKLPALADAQRFWGDRLLLPLGQRLEPDLPASAVCDTLGAAGDGIILWTEGGPELIPGDRFRPLSRASIRVASSGAPEVAS